MSTHSTPSGVVVEYFESLRWLVQAASETTGVHQTRRLAATSTILAVAAIEVFLNLWFRIHATESTDATLQNSLLKDLRKKITLEQKLSEWPKRHFHAGLDLKSGPGKAFVSLKNRRNSIVHFETSHETIHTSNNLILHGLADTSEYDALSAGSTADALATAEELVIEIFRLAGFDDKQMGTALAAWIGKPAANSSGDATSTNLPTWLAPHVER